MGDNMAPTFPIYAAETSIDLANCVLPRRRKLLSQFTRSRIICRIAQCDDSNEFFGCFERRLDLLSSWERIRDIDTAQSQSLRRQEDILGGCTYPNNLSGVTVKRLANRGSLVWTLDQRQNRFSSPGKR